MNKPEVLKYTLMYYKMGRTLHEETPETYYFHLFRVILREVGKGFRAIKIDKPTSKGTRITFVAIRTFQEADEVNNQMTNMAREFNEKYNAGIGITEDENE